MTATHPSAKPTPHLPRNLPIPATPLVGREDDIAALETLVRDGVRLISLTGSPGIGKTRLADTMTDGVVYVPLTSVHDAAYIGSTIARALGVTEGTGRPLPETLARALHDKQMLLLLDHVEQVPDTAPHVAALLAAPRLTVIVTSRTALGITGEYGYSVPPLMLPDRERLPALEHLREYGAIRLFIERTQAVNPHFALSDKNARAVAELCHDLGGVPLAIEIVAARSAEIASPTALADLRDRVRALSDAAHDAPTDEERLRAVIAWNERLLASPEQRLFARLSVLVGRCTPEAAMIVCDDGTLDIANGVRALCAANLVQRTVGHDGIVWLDMRQPIHGYEH